MTRKCLNNKTLCGWCFSVKNCKSLYTTPWMQRRLKSTDLSIISTKNVLSNSNRKNCINLLNNMEPVYKTKSDKIQKAAVLVPLCEVDGELAFLYTLRARHLKVNGGEVAFPGGKADDSDRSLEVTALRECYEEIGISQNQVDIWGKGPEIYRKDVVVTPILGYIGDLNKKKLVVNVDEVSVVFPATLHYLSSPQNFQTTQFRSGKYISYKMPVYLTNPKRVWGLTAVMTHIMLSCLIPMYYSKNIQFNLSYQKIPYPKKV